MNLHEFHHIVQDIQKNIPCRGCKHHFKESDIRIIGTIYNEAFFHAECHRCQGHTLIAGLLQQTSNHKESGETQRVRRSIKKSLKNGTELRIINTNDILDMHNFLKEFNGDFTTLFESKSKNSTASQ